MRRMNFSIGKLVEGYKVSIGNNTWYRPIEILESGQADIAIARFGMSISRMLVCDFTLSFNEGPEYLHLRKPTETTSRFNNFEVIEF